VARVVNEVTSTTNARGNVSESLRYTLGAPTSLASLTAFPFMALWRSNGPPLATVPPCARRAEIPIFPGYLFVLLDLMSGTVGSLRPTPAACSGIVTPGSRLRVYRGALARQVLECLAVDDVRGIVRALWEALGRTVECSGCVDAPGSAWSLKASMGYPRKDARPPPSRGGERAASRSGARTVPEAAPLPRGRAWDGAGVVSYPRALTGLPRAPGVSASTAKSPGMARRTPRSTKARASTKHVELRAGVGRELREHLVPRERRRMLVPILMLDALTLRRRQLAAQQRLGGLARRLIGDQIALFRLPSVKCRSSTRLWTSCSCRRAVCSIRRRTGASLTITARIARHRSSRA
jgi:hypothetical protein